MTIPKTRNRLSSVTLILTICYITLFFIQVGCISREPSTERPILVFAAASLVNSMTEIETKFEEHYDIDVSVSFGGSQMLLQQIIRGAPADIFIPAGNFQTAALKEHDLLYGEPTNILLNQLVVISRPEMSIRSLDELANDQFSKIAIANPKLAPAGNYAREALITANVWESIRGKIILGIDVRASLGYVESGNVDASIVYKTDAATVDKPISIYEVPPDAHPGIQYPAALIYRTDRHEFSQKFINFLTTVHAVNIFESYGFEQSVSKD